MQVPYLRPPTAQLSEEEALKRVEALRRDLPKSTAKPPAGIEFENFKRNWQRYMRREG